MSRYIVPTTEEGHVRRLSAQHGYEKAIEEMNVVYNECRPKPTRIVCPHRDGWSARTSL